MFAVRKPITNLDGDNATFKAPLSMTGSVRLPLKKDYWGYPFSISEKEAWTHPQEKRRERLNISKRIASFMIDTHFLIDTTYEKDQLFMVLLPAFFCGPFL